MRRVVMAAVMGLALVSAPGGASQKPCRDAQGRVIRCPKPDKPKPHRCKDATGRFVPCEHPPAGK